MIKKIEFINRSYRHFDRYKKILTTLVKYGFEDFVEAIHLEKYINLGRRILPGKHIIKKNKHISRWQRLRMCLEDLGPTFIKLGQVMSTRADLFPQELLLELEKLQSSASPIPQDQIIKILETELGKPINEVFVNFSVEPLASASIAQVHQGILKSSNEKVAIKIQRPKIQKIIEVDLEIMFYLAALLEKYIEGMRIVNASKVVEQFKVIIKKEINFQMEAIHIERFSIYLKNDPNIYVPKVYKEFSNKKILVMEFIEGYQLSHGIENLPDDLNKKIVARRGNRVILKQILDYGFFHADPHAGNIMILPNNVVCFLDFGMMGSLSLKYRKHLLNIILGIVQRNPTKITDALERISQSKYIYNKEMLEDQIMELLNQYSYLPLKDINLGKFLNDILGILIYFEIKIEPIFYVLLKSLVSIEGIARRLDPNFNTIENLKPVIYKSLKKYYGVKEITKNTIDSIVNFIQMTRAIPFELHDVLQIIKRGDVKISLDHRGLDSLVQSQIKNNNRLVFSIVIAALIIGSSIITHSNIYPQWHGIPIIGIIGFVLAAIIGFWLLFSMILKGKVK